LPAYWRKLLETFIFDAGAGKRTKRTLRHRDQRLNVDLLPAQQFAPVACAGPIVSGGFGIILVTSKQVHPADRVLGEVFVEGFGVSKKSERLVVKRKGEMIFERPFFDVERVIVATEGATITAAAIHECVKNGIPFRYD
jgi:hypothetical protein